MHNYSVLLYTVISNTKYQWYRVLRNGTDVFILMKRAKYFIGGDCHELF
jgi:hypothetical protein